MVATINQRKGPLGLVVTGEASWWQPALEQIIGPAWLTTYNVRGEGELLDVVEAGLADAAVLDDESELELDVLHLLRMIRRLDEAFPVVVVTRRRDRRWMENALSLTAFSVIAKPLELEMLLRQIQRIMRRLDEMLRQDADE